MINKNRIQLINPPSREMADILNKELTSDGSLLVLGMGYGGVGTLTFKVDGADSPADYTRYSEEYILSGVDKGMFIFDITPLIIDHEWVVYFFDANATSNSYVALKQTFVADAWRFVLLWEDDGIQTHVFDTPFPVGLEKYRVWFEFNHDAPIPPSVGADPVDGFCTVTVERISNGVKDSATAAIPAASGESPYPTYLNLGVVVSLNSMSPGTDRYLQVQTKKFMAEGDTPLPPS